MENECYISQFVRPEDTLQVLTEVVSSPSATPEDKAIARAGIIKAREAMGIVPVDDTPAIESHDGVV